MNQHTVGVFSGRDDLVPRLSEACRSWRFSSEENERNACRLAVFDIDTHALLADPTRKSVVRIVLCDGSFPPTRRRGEIRVDRKVFLADPDEYLSFGLDLAETAVHASQLEHEVGYLEQIHEMMSMVDAYEVSEKITRTVLDLLGLQTGTLFLHDPRLERYVVSFSNDGTYRETGEFLPGVPPGLLQKALSSGKLFASERDEKGNGMIIMPLQVQEDLIGVIKVPLRPADELTDEAAGNVTHYLSAVAQVLSNIYQLTRSRDLAMRDDLTKAFNRRFFESYLDEEIERARRYGTLFSIIFLDLDDLKMVNNFYGHLTGSPSSPTASRRDRTA